VASTICFTKCCFNTYGRSHSNERWIRTRKQGWLMEQIKLLSWVFSIGNVDHCPR
jgi:hypothetical protein